MGEFKHDLFVGKNVTLTGNWRDLAAEDQSMFLAKVPFQWFCTFTFKNETHPEAAHKSFTVWMNILNRSNYGKRWSTSETAAGGVGWLRALEWQKRGVLHYHALLFGIKNSGVPYAQIAEMTWSKKLQCGFARIDIVDSDQKKVVEYCSKYLCKGGELDYSDNFAQGLAPDQVSNGVRYTV